MKEIMKLVDICKGHKVYVQTHNFHDPDAIASAYGLQKLLGHFEIPATICYAGKIDKLSAAKMLDTFGIEMYPYDELKEKAFMLCRNTITGMPIADILFTAQSVMITPWNFL